MIDVQLTHMEKYIWIHNKMGHNVSALYSTALNRKTADNANDRDCLESSKKFTSLSRNRCTLYAVTLIVQQLIQMKVLQLKWNYGVTFPCQSSKLINPLTNKGLRGTGGQCSRHYNPIILNECDWCEIVKDYIRTSLNMGSHLIFIVFL